MKSVGEPDAGNPHVRFDERGAETGQAETSEAPAAQRAGTATLDTTTAPHLDSTAFSTPGIGRPKRGLASDCWWSWAGERARWRRASGAARRGLAGRQREGADACADYLLKYAATCRYDDYLASGLPIASGVIEGACRHLVSDRLDITGARWGLEGAEAALKVRSLRSSGDFDQYRAFHQRRVLHRLHLNSYASGAIPQPLPSTTPRLRTAGLQLVSTSRIV